MLKNREEKLLTILKVLLVISGVCLLLVVLIVVVIIRSIQRDKFCWQVVEKETSKIASKMIDVPPDVRDSTTYQQGDKISMKFYKQLQCMQKNKF